MEKRFGENNVASVGTYTTYQIRAIIKDFGKQWGLEHSEVNFITTALDEVSSLGDLFKMALKKPIIYKFIQKNGKLVNSIQYLLNQPKARSIHACAMMIFPKEKTMFEWTPVRIQNGIYVTEFEGGELESSGFLKEDILGIRQLTKFHKIVDLIKKNKDIDIDIYNIPFSDEKVFSYFGKGWTGDVFHFGAYGLTQYCKLLKPENIDELILGIALYRPGAIENNFHKEYIDRKELKKKIKYPIGCENITKETKGLLVYQEQIMKACVEVGGLSLVESDDIRKAMGKKKHDLLNSFELQFIEGGIKKGFEKSQLKELWDTLKKFASYGFNRCLSGSEVIYKQRNGGYKKYSIKEMYELMNGGMVHAKRIKRVPQYSRYKVDGHYGYTLSLRENGRLYPNLINNIRYSGKRQLFKMTLEDGKSVLCTDNHKFPTSNGEKELRNIDINNDLIFIYGGYEKSDTAYRWTDRGDWDDRYQKKPQEKYLLNIEKGKMGFQKRKTPYTILRDYKKNHKKDYCENHCGKNWKKLEIHHIDGNHGNNDFSNLKTLCSSCHKEEHYKMGRAKKGEKGLLTKQIKIKSIEFSHYDDTYDIEMENPYHNFLLNSGIVTSNSHAAAYTITGYVSQWLKVHYPLEYWTVALDMIPEQRKKDLLPRFIAEINETGSIKLLPPDINKSSTHFYTDYKTDSIFWSFISIKRVGEIAVEQITKDRDENGEYFSFEEFYSRHKFKGSKVNKSVYEGLILSGAFDFVENIEHYSGRRKILKQYWELAKIKVKGESNSIFEEWYYPYQQKLLCGYAIFNYKELSNLELPEHNFVTSEEMQEKLNKNRIMSIAGFVQEINVRSSSRGEWANVILESNYHLITVRFWSDVWKTFKEKVEGSEKTIMVISGRVKYDDYSQKNIIEAEKKSKIIIKKI